ncbi:uncharacterized protein LOC119570242 [Penaeus monodon]|uniref:uncharacterized protein LOC119570242 n=1 Tax=Penaeus monodon TaxID=6687 RepID=UPI0018A7D0EA|nr:uncharacterized protein LOC119570242 [Penaeus monodon]
MTAVQMREHQLQDPKCEDLLGWLEGHRAVPGKRPPAALSSFEVEEGVLYYLRTFPDGLVREYVASCHVCQQCKGVAGRAPMEGHPLPEAQLVRVSADLMDLRGRVLQAFVDHYVTLFGPPDHLHTDNGLEFSSDEWRSLTMAHSFIVAYHPQSNGVVERTNRTVKDALSALAWQAPSQWPTHLPAVRLALNSAIHRAVGDQPLYLLMGRMALFGKGLTNRQTVDPDLILGRLADARRLAVEVSRKMHETNKAQYDRAARTSGPYEEGTLVLRKVLGNRGPLGDRWLGPAVYRSGWVLFVMMFWTCDHPSRCQGPC